MKIFSSKSFKCNIDELKKKREKKKGRKKERKECELENKIK